MYLLTQLEKYARDCGQHCAIEHEQGCLSYQELWQAVRELSEQLQVEKVQHIGLWLENSVQWVVVQLAAFNSGVALTPIPVFFTRRQAQHAADQSGVDLLFASSLEQAQQLDSSFRLDSIIPSAFRRYCAAITCHLGTALVTYTSGTTANPKGVCLSLQHLNTVCNGLYESIAVIGIARHLCLMPLAVLLENLAGVLLPLMAGKTVVLLAPKTMGIGGSGFIDIETFASCFDRYRPDSVILTPQLLKVIVGLVAAKAIHHRPLFMAVGGGRVATALLSQAKKYGLSVYEGYGLSECASVTALNLPTNNRRGSVGKPLPYCQITIADDGEVLVKNSAMLGYLGSPPLRNHMIASGDVGYLDEEGFLFIRGRKKNIFISTQGRNLSPEWIESELCSLTSIYQACLYGDGEDFLLAIVSLLPETTATNNHKKNVQQPNIQKQLDALNQTLPDYAQVTVCIQTTEPFSVANGQLTSNGRIRRDGIYAAYRDRIEAAYQRANASVAHRDYLFCKQRGKTA
jgi:long-subunit acyl-CoA synthetase (AMP-forming)